MLSSSMNPYEGILEEKREKDHARGHSYMLHPEQALESFFFFFFFNLSISGGYRVMGTHPNVHRKGTGGKTSPAQIAELKPGGAPHGATGHRATAIWNTQSKDKSFTELGWTHPSVQPVFLSKSRRFPGFWAAFRRRGALQGRAGYLWNDLTST